MDYVRNPKEDGCIFCKKSKSNKNRENLVLFRGTDSFVLMNLYPYNNAHLLIAPYEHVATTIELSAQVSNEMMNLTNESMRIIKETMNAEGFNFGANIGAIGGAGIKDHIHFHVVPRWLGDTNFMPVIGHTKVMVEGLLETYDELKPHFEKIKLI
ncbi:MAG: HIT domain-containing protein, partial [Planctomycetia bacterium]|nr:HIT domain-containing protein [Planctomycetia bacterium]